MGWGRALEEIAKERKIPTDYVSHTEIMERLFDNRRKAISDSYRILNPGGGILEISSRFAFHGGGHSLDDLNCEKRQRIALAQQLKDLGAELTIIGLSKQKTLEGLSKYPEFAHISRTLTETDALFDFSSVKLGVYEEDYETDFEEKMRNLCDEIPLGRIDAVYAKKPNQ